jgi:TonB family protein
MQTRAQRRAKTRQSTILAVLASSAVAHAAVVATLDLGRPLVSHQRRRPAAVAEIDWTFTCSSDALLAATVRLGVCGSPFADRARCVDDALAGLAAARAACETPEEVEIAFVDVDALDLAPVPLLEDVAPTPDTTTAQIVADEVAAKLEEATKAIEQPKPGQVVEITRPEVEVAPTDARYLAEFDSKVTKQTAARASTEEMVARPQAKEATPTATPPPPPPDSAPAAKPGVPGAAGPPSSSMLAMRDPSRSAAAPTAERTGTPGERTGSELASIEGIKPRLGDGGAAGAPLERSPVGAPAGGEGGDGGVKAPELRPSEELLERAVGGGSVDDLDDAETGDFTALNTRKWKYAGFFNRMKRQVAQSWHPDVVYGRHDPTGKVYGAKDRVTVLQVSLTPTGSLAKVYVVKASGVEFLDDEAERAFREAQPFPNPPSALVDARSNLITFSFGFNFQIGGDRSTWRVFRQN